jgi:hypothetical protein
MPPYAAPGTTAGTLSGPVAQMGAVGPFVPARWRTPAMHAADVLRRGPAAPTAADVTTTEPVAHLLVEAPGDVVAATWTAESGASAGTMPWIDAFLRSTPPAPMQAVSAVDETHAGIPEAGWEGSGTPDTAFRDGDASDTAFIESVVAVPVDEAVPPDVPVQDVFGDAALIGPAAADWEAADSEVVEAEQVEEAPLEAAASEADPIEAEQVEEYPLEAVASDANLIEANPIEATVLESGGGDAVETASDVVAEAGAELWPLEDAAAAFHDLSASLETLTAHDRHEAMPDVATLPPPAAALAPWQDDDFVDIMPMPTGYVPGDSLPASFGSVTPDAGTQNVEAASASAERDHAAGPSVSAIEARAEDAALALEQLAQRMRAGELAVPSYDPRLGEQAALVAALAAVLGVRAR